MHCNTYSILSNPQNDITQLHGLGYWKDDLNIKADKIILTSSVTICFFPN